MKLKKVAATLLAGALAVSMGACTPSTPAENSPTPTPKAPETQKQTEEDTEKGTEKQTEKQTEEAGKSGVDLKAEDATLSMWCIATEKDSNRKAYEQAIEEMETEYPNIDFEWEAFENQSYKPKIKAAVSADELPDIFFTWSCAFLGDFVSAGKVYCLDAAYVDYKSELPEVMLANSTYDGKHYGVPLTMNIVGLFANMDLLKEAGWDKVPETYDELIKCCDDLKAKGITPFGCAGKETWCVTEYLEPIMEKNIGAEQMNKIFLGQDSWDNAGVKDSVDIFQKMIKDGYFDASGAGLGNDEVKANFMQGKYAFYQNGTWNCADFANDAEFFKKVKVTEFPVIDSSKSKLGQLIGGPSDTLAVAASSENAEIAAKYTFELGKRICHYGYLAGNGLPAWTPYGDTSGINDLTKAVSDICANADSYVLFGDTAMSADDAATYLDYVAKVYGSEIDGQAFVDGLKKDIR